MCGSDARGFAVYVAGLAGCEASCSGTEGEDCGGGCGGDSRARVDSGD